MKSPALALIMIVVILTSNCVRNIPKDRQPNLIILLAKDFVEQKAQHEWFPRKCFYCSFVSNMVGRGSLGFSPEGVVVYAAVLAGVIVLVSGHVIVHNVKGTNVSLVIDEDAQTAPQPGSDEDLLRRTQKPGRYDKDTAWQETYELNWGTNRLFLSEEKVSALEKGTATLRLIATGTRELELGVPTEGMKIKRDVHIIEFTKSGDIIVDGTGITSSDEQTGPQAASEEDLAMRPQESGQDDKESQN